MILKYFYYILLGLVLANFVIGRKGASIDKRKPVFFWAVIIFITMIIALFTVNKGWPEYLPLAFFCMNIILAATIYRHIYFPYKFKCEKCGASLSRLEIFIEDGYLCADCKPAVHDGNEETDEVVKDDNESPWDS